MIRKLVLALLLLAGPAVAQQTVLQGGTWVAGDIPVYRSGSGFGVQPVIIDSGMNLSPTAGALTIGYLTMYPIAGHSTTIPAEHNPSLVYSYMNPEVNISGLYGNIFASATYAKNTGTDHIVAVYGTGEAAGAGSISFGANFNGEATHGGATTTGVEIDAAALTSGTNTYGLVIDSTGTNTAIAAIQIGASDSSSNFVDAIVIDNTPDRAFSGSLITSQSSNASYGINLAGTFTTAEWSSPNFVVGATTSGNIEAKVQVQIDPAAVPLIVKTNTAGGAINFYGAASGTNPVGPNINMLSSRGTVGSPLTLVSGDTFGEMAFFGYDGTNYLDRAEVRAIVGGAVTTGNVIADLAFKVSSSDGSSITTGMALMHGSILSIASGGATTVNNTGDPLQVNGTMSVGTYTGSTCSNSGYITIHDIAGNARKVMICS